jgi:hypothetical protein
MKVPYTPSGKAEEEPPELWAVVVGVADYAGDGIDLRYSAKDAEDFATALKLAAERLFGEERVHLTVLTERPTRAGLLEALEAVKEAKPKDLLVLYLAGHGVNWGGQDGDFHYLTAEARTADLTDPAVREQVSLSSRELTERIKVLPPLKQVLILDTCAAGKLVEKLTEVRNVPASQVRALDRLKDRTGLHVLAGCASDRVSYEATRYGQGLLTHSLLMAMKGAALKEEEFVDVSTLFGFAADRVPQLARDIGGIQRPVIASPKGVSFYIGRLIGEDKEKIPLQTMRPLFLRSNFQDEDAIEDVLGLAKRVDALLTEASARGREAPLVFVDAREYPEAYRLAGRYRVEGEQAVVDVRIRRGSEEVGRFSVEGEPDALAGRIVAEARRWVR